MDAQRAALKKRKQRLAVLVNNAGVSDGGCATVHVRYCQYACVHVCVCVRARACARVCVCAEEQWTSCIMHHASCKRLGISCGIKPKYECCSHLLPGVMGVSSSPSGADRHMRANHLGPFLLTRLLESEMGPGSRVVNVASRAHYQVSELVGAVQGMCQCVVEVSPSPKGGPTLKGKGRAGWLLQQGPNLV